MRQMPRARTWVARNCRHAAAGDQLSECPPDFGSMLDIGHKGMLLDDGNWVTWQVDESGWPDHGEVQEACFRYNNILTTATHWFDGTLSIFSDEPFSEQTQGVVRSFHGNRGSGSKIIIETMDGTAWEGDFRKYQKELYDHDVVGKWVLRNCRFAASLTREKYDESDAWFRRPRVYDPESLDLDAPTYFDVAHADDAIVWAWNPGERKVVEALPGELHHDAWDVDGGEVAWRGRYDPKTGDLSLLTDFMTPAGVSSHEPPPEWLLDKLRDMYGPTQIHVF